MGIFSKEKKVVFAVGHLLESEATYTSKIACGSRNLRRKNHDNQTRN